MLIWMVPKDVEVIVSGLSGEGILFYFYFIMNNFLRNIFCKKERGNIDLFPIYFDTVLSCFLCLRTSENSISKRKFYGWYG